MTPVVFKVYICADEHFFDGATAITQALTGRLVCSMCNQPVVEVEVVRVDELKALSLDALVAFVDGVKS